MTPHRPYQVDRFLQDNSLATSLSLKQPGKTAALTVTAGLPQRPQYVCRIRLWTGCRFFGDVDDDEDLVVTGIDEAQGESIAILYENTLY